MQTDYLRYFVDVATLGSMNAAAKKNYMSPQGISRSISALEGELGCPLFQRDSNKVTLTAYGERLLRDAHRLLDDEKQMRLSVSELRGESLRKRKIQFTGYFSPIFFDTPLLFPASGLNTAIYGKVQFFQRSTPEIVKLLIDSVPLAHPNFVFAGGVGLIDLFPEENSHVARKLTEAGYEYRPFMHTHDYVLVPAYSPFANEECLTKMQIRSHPLAVAANGAMERAITRHIGSDSIYVSSGDSAYRSRLCRMGEALTFVPGLSLAFGVPEGTVAVSMEEPYTVEVGFVAHSSAFKEGILADIVERLTEYYSKYQVEGAYRLLDGTLEDSIVVL